MIVASIRIGRIVAGKYIGAGQVQRTHAYFGLAPKQRRKFDAEVAKLRAAEALASRLRK